MTPYHFVWLYNYSINVIFENAIKNEMKQKKNIDFFGIGTQKSGTTWLHYILNNIPEFSLPPVKELHYFDRSPNYPSPNYLSEDLFLNRILKTNWLKVCYKTLISIIQRDWKSVLFYFKWNFSNYSDTWYLSLFHHFRGFTGEITPSYSILSQEDIKRIHKLIPNAKLVLMLRNPIERAWSGYRHYNKRIPNFNFDTVTNEEIIEFMESEYQTFRSDYVRTLNNYLKVFPNEQILIGFYDAIVDDPTSLLNNILKHICGNTKVSIKHLNLKKRVNKSPSFKCPPEVKEYLKLKYHDQIKELSDKYDGYFTKWYEDAYSEKFSNKNIKLMPTVFAKS